MEIIVNKTFFKNLDKLKNKSFHAKIDEIIEEIKSASTLSEIKNLKQLSSGKTKDYFRLRIADYRIGIRIIESKNYICPVKKFILFSIKAPIKFFKLISVLTRIPFKNTFFKE